MSGLVGGYSGIIAPPNLATNGSFAINQRGFTATPWGALSHGDYFADCWKVGNETNVDILKGIHNAAGLVTIDGVAKKGQVILLENKDASNIGYNPLNATRSPITSSVTCGCGISSVPVEIVTVPRLDHGSFASIHDAPANLKAGQTKVTSSSYATRLFNLNRGAYVYVTIQEDGEFQFTLSSFMELAGAFKNPPKYAPVPYADDLARCQRYYQKGNLNDVGVFASYSADAVIRTPVQFTTEMVAAPSVAITSVSSGYYNGAGVYTGFTPSHGTVGIKTTGFSCSTSTNDGTAVTQLTSNGGETDFNWTAEVV
jgi:hypothetical protein